MASTTFGPLEIAFDDDDVLTPRGWTIEQARWAIEVSPSLPDGPVLELCCGAGHIGLVVAVETGRALVQVDDDVAACGYARRNADAAGVASDVRCAAIDDAVGSDERFAVIVADPPYVPSDQTDRFDADPDHAIDGGTDGLAVARRCLDLAATCVLPGGAVLIQAGGARQAETLAGEATTRGLRRLDVRTFGPDRAVLLLAPR